MNNKAWLRIVEAMIAILIIMGGVLVVLNNKSINKETPESLYDKQSEILDLISKNESLRNYVIIGDKANIDKFITRVISLNWNFTTKICNLEEICNAETPNDKDVFVSEILITSSTTDYSPKKLRFFVWTGETLSKTTPPAMSIVDSSSNWLEGEEIYSDYKTGANDGSKPPLKIENIPENAISLALIFENEQQTEVYWIVWDIPYPGTSLITDSNWPESGEGIQGKNTQNQQKLYKGPHDNGNYKLTIYALSINSLTMDPIALSSDNTRIQFKQKIQGNIIQSASLNGKIT
ncbi:MAG: hypothetical protein Q8N99_00505 [Nanoarchaeota archaeon]|nr:hypothetical protein [Nanoarchaeota archaeon]